MARGSHDFATPLVGRTGELTELGERFDACLNGNPQVVILAGEAGIGKSRLVAEFLQLTEGSLAIVGHCLELGPDGPPFAPFAMMLRGLVAELNVARITELAGPSAADLAVLAPELGRGGDSDPLGRGRLFEAMATLIEHAAEERPIVVAVEDLHWSDSSTRDLTSFLIRTITSSRVMFVLTYRSDELPRSHPLLRWLSEVDRLPASHRMTVGRLADTDVDEMVRVLAGEVPARTAARIRERSEGIPFFIEELTSCCGVEPDLPSIPESLRDLMLARLDRLTDPTRAIVRMASAANTKVDHAVLRAMAGMDEEALDGALREAVHGQVLVVDADQRGYAFRHALMREAVHDDLLPGEHARLHAQYAQALEQGARPDQAGEIAHHWMSAHEAAKSFEWSLRAADHSRSVYAWQEELNHLNRALDLWDRVDDAEQRIGRSRVELIQRAGRAAGDTGRSEQAIAFFDAAIAEVDEAEDPQHVAQLLVQRAAQCAIPRDTLPDLQRALELAASGTRDRAAALCQIAAWYMLAGRLGEARTWGQEALSAAEEAGAADLMGHAANTLGCSLMHNGEAEEGFRTLERARELALSASDWPGLLRYFGNLSDMLIGSGRFGEAVGVAHEGRALAAERGWNRTMGAFLGGNEAEAMLHAGRWDEALVMIDDVLRLDPPTVTRAHVLILRSAIKLRRGDLTGCANDIDTAIDRIGYAINQPQYAMPIAAVRGALDADAEDFGHALGRLATATRGETLSLPMSAAWPFAFAWARLINVAAQSHSAASLGDDLRSAQRGAAELAAYCGSVTDHAGLRALLRAQLHDNDVELRRVSAALGPAGDPPARSDDRSPGGQVQLDRRPELEVVDEDACQLWSAAVAGLLASDGLHFERAYAQLRLAQELMAAGSRAEARDRLVSAWKAIDDLGAESLRPMAARTAAAARLQLRPARRGAQLLTDREREVLDLVAAGRSNKAISDELFISVKTTSVHVSHILAKIGASSRTEAAAWAHENGIGRAGGLQPQR